MIRTSLPFRRAFSTSVSLRRIHLKATHSPPSQPPPIPKPSLTIKPYKGTPNPSKSKTLSTNNASTPPPNPPPTPPRRTTIARLILYYSSFAIFTHIFLTHFYEVSEAYGASMLPTMYLSGEWFIISKRHKWGRGIEVGDIITARSPTAPGMPIMKRVLGMPGDFVIGGEVFPFPDEDGERGVQHPHGQAEDVDSLSVIHGAPPFPATHPNGRMIQVPRGHCFLSGDNQNFSRDSRHYGVVPLGCIKGKVIARVLPWRRAGWVENTLVDVDEADLRGELYGGVLV